MSQTKETHWRTDGVRVVKAGTLDSNTLQTPGMSRAAAITRAGWVRRNSGQAR